MNHLFTIVSFNLVGIVLYEETMENDPNSCSYTNQMNIFFKYKTHASM